MKLHLDSPMGRNVVTAYGAGYVAVNRVRHANGLVLLPERIIEPWGSAGFEGLTEADFQVLGELRAEVVLLGTGSQQRFPPARLLRPLIEAGIGCEVMNLAAACRTYNILVAEGRRVAAALLVENGISARAGAGDASVGHSRQDQA